MQWLVEAGDEAPAVAASSEVSAFSEGAGVTLLRPEWHARRLNRLEIRATARSPDGRRHRLRQIATTPGQLVPR